MALRINTNVTALNAHGNLVRNDDRLSGTIERLSSGLRINRASDDAAGLTISEKLRTQVRGINRAIMNVQDGMSLIQTAEGALNETHSMLQRMRELAIQAANDTLTTTDRLEIQKEIQQLKEDINRISYGTEFNTRKLLDGTGTAAISTSSPKNMDGVVVADVQTFSDFSITVFPKTDRVIDENGNLVTKVYKGTAQVQRSAIFMRSDGVVASGSTTLQSISNFYDKNGFFILDEPQTLYVQGDNAQGTVQVSKDITLDQLAQRMQAAMTKDQLGKGLKFDGSVASMKTMGDSSGQLETTSGKTGKIGRVNFTGEENLVKALGFETVIAPEDPVYDISSVNLGVDPGERVIMTTQVAGHRATGLIQGVDLVFQPPVSAFAQTSSAKTTLGISIPTGFTFDVDDSVSATGTVNIAIASGVWAMDQVVSLFNEQLSVAVPTSLVRAKLNDAYAIEFYTFNTGSAAYVSIGNMTLSPNPLGIANGRYAGTGGNSGAAVSNQPIPSFSFNNALGNVIRFQVTDMHSATTMTTITLSSDYSAGGMTSLVDAINMQIASNNLQIRAFDYRGQLQFRSLETGVDSNFTIRDDNGGIPLISSLYMNDQTTNSGFDGNAADQNFAYDQSASKYGYVIAESSSTAGVDNLSFYIADLDGKGFSIAVAAGSAGNSFRTLTSIANLINNAADVNGGVKVAVEIISSNQTMRIFSKTPGTQGKVTFAEWGSPDSINTLLSVTGVQPKTYQNGDGDFEFKMHVKDTFIQFQIGPNQGHNAKCNIIRTDVVALGIRDLEVTNVNVAQEAITLIDKALQRISSERAKLGAIENRMTYTVNSLRVGYENMSAADSRIRDVDMAREVIEMTRFQVLQQSSNAMLAQANATSQRVLDLLR